MSLAETAWVEAQAGPFRPAYVQERKKEERTAGRERPARSALKRRNRVHSG